MTSINSFLQQLAYACLISWAIAHAMIATGMIMDRQVAYQIIQGGK